MVHFCAKPAPSVIPLSGTRGPSGLLTIVPGYFACVMATGIVSLAAHLRGWELIALALFWLNVGAYLFLGVVTLVRLTRFPAPFIGSLAHHSRGTAFLTIIPGTCVLGSQFALLTSWVSVARLLWIWGTGLWLLLSYAFLIAMTVCEEKPPFGTVISGAWLLIVVATESLSILGTLVAPTFRSMAAVLFLGLAAYLVGAMLYVCFCTMILHRWLFFPMTPDDLAPDCWINMGALAITTLAGALLLRAAGQWKLLQDLAPFLTGSALLCWAAATWWLPLLLCLEIWRHLGGRVPLSYSPGYWSLVFPLGMYAAATFIVVQATGLTFLYPIGEVFVYGALLAWGIVFVGMTHRAARSFWQADWSEERRPRLE